MQRLLLTAIVSMILVTTGCFGDADSKTNSRFAEFDALELVGGDFASEGFVQFNSKTQLNFKTNLFAISESETEIINSDFYFIHNSLSDQYSYFVNFDAIGDDVYKLQLELLKGLEVAITFTLNVEPEHRDVSIDDVRELGESAVFDIGETSITGYNVSTLPNILVEFSKPVNPSNVNFILESMFDNAEIPMTIEYTKNPSILLQIKEKLDYNSIYKLAITDKTNNNVSNILLQTKSFNSVFQTLATDENNLILLTSNYMLDLSSELEVNKIVEFKDAVSFAVQGLFVDQGSDSFIVLTTNNELKLIDNFKVVNITGNVNLSVVSGIVSADFDNDGLDEILFYDNIGHAQIYRLKDDLELEFYDQYNLSIPNDIMTCLTVEDIDFNGYYDFVIGYSSGAILSLLRSEADFVFQLTPIAFLDSSIDSIMIADLNRDIMPDIAVLDRTGKLSVVYNQVNAWEIQSIQVASFLDSFYLHDLNNDGYIDIIASGSNGFVEYLENHAGLFKSKILDNPENQFSSEVLFASGLTRDNSRELMIYQPMMNMIRTLSITGEFYKVDLNTNEKTEVKLQKTPFSLDVSPNRIISADFNNDRRLDILVIAKDSLTVYLQRFRNETVSNKFMQKYRLFRAIPGKVEVVDLFGNAYKELVFVDNDKLIIVSTLDYRDISLTIPLELGDTIVDFAKFNYLNRDYLAILTKNKLMVGYLKNDDTSQSYEFSLVQSQNIVADHIEVIDFNVDGMPDALLKSNSNSIIMFSEESADNEIMFFYNIVDFSQAQTLSNDSGSENTLANVNESNIQLYKFTLQGLDSERIDITKLDETSNETQIIQNDFDHDGDEDIIVLRKSNQLFIDILINVSNSSYKHSPEISQKMTSIVKNSKLRYVGFLDIDSDSWSDIVFCNDKQELFTLKIK